jgi:hypothetical protein
MRKIFFPSLSATWVRPLIGETGWLIMSACHTLRLVESHGSLVLYNYIYDGIRRTIPVLLFFTHETTHQGVSGSPLAPMDRPHNRRFMFPGILRTKK